MSLTYNCSEKFLYLQNDAFTTDPTELTITITYLNDTCTGQSSEYIFQSGLTMDYNSLTKTVSLDATEVVADTGDGVYTLEYEYSSVTYTACVFVLCDGKCDIYNAIYDNLGQCATCDDSQIDKAYNIFMATQVVTALTECDQCCKAKEAYEHLLTLISGCTTC